MTRRLLSALWWSFPLLTVVLASGTARAQAGDLVFQADVHFPDAGDDAQLAAAPQLGAAGDSITGVRTLTGLARIDDLDVHLVVEGNTLADRAECALPLELTINGVLVDTLSVGNGDLAVDAFLQSAEPIAPAEGGLYTFVLSVPVADPARPADCGTITLPEQKSLWHLELEEPAGDARPRGAAGGPYTVLEGGAVAMAATGLDPDGEAAPGFAWDFDGDGEFDDGAGATASFSAAAVDGAAAPGTVRMVKLQLSDAGGASRVLEATVTVSNVAPAFDETVVPAALAAKDVAYRFLPRVVDPGALDVLSYTLLPGKPAGMTVAANGQVEWTPSAAVVGQSFNVRLEVRDDDGGVDLLEWTVRAVADLEAPTVDAGEDRTVDPGCLTLTCTGVDPRQRPLGYHWTRVRGAAAVTFSDPEAAETRVVLTQAGEYTFSCTATEQVAEGEGALTSLPDEVKITVANLPPVADAGFDTFGKTTQRITLDGRRSTDPNGDGLRYRWEQVTGDSVRISGATNAITSFSPLTTDIYCFTLTVQDADGLSSDPAPVCVVVNQLGDPERCTENSDCAQNRCQPVTGETYSRCEPFTTPDYNPVAWAGEDQWGLVDQLVQLEGMRSYDPDGQQPFLEEYVWTPCSPLAEAVALEGQGLKRPSFTPTEPGRYCFDLVVRDSAGHHSLADRVQVVVEESDNFAPLADAGAGVAVQRGGEVVLDASLSRDPDGDPLFYQWTQQRGPHVVLDDPTSVTPRFCSSIPGIYQFGLEVTDDHGLEGVPAEVWVSVTSPCNQAPVAKAGSDFTVLTDDGDEGTLQDRAVLDGRQTFDPDPAPALEVALDGLRFQWVQTGGMPVELQLPFTRRPWFRTKQWGIYTFRLFVLDAWSEGAAPESCWTAAWSLPDDVTVTVDDLPGEGNVVPLANAGPDKDCLLGEQCHLDGQGSVDADSDPLSYRWAQTGGSLLALADTETASPYFQADELGEWTFRLVVSDGFVRSRPDDVRIRVRTNDNKAPICRAGRPQSVRAGQAVVLNGCGSLDENGDSMAFSWTQTAGTTVEGLAQGEGADACKATFVAPVAPGDYTFQLVASDGRLECAPASVVVTVLEPTLVCEPGDFAQCTCENGQSGRKYCNETRTDWLRECVECHDPCQCLPAEEDIDCTCDNGWIKGHRTCGDSCMWNTCEGCVPPETGGEDDGSSDDGCTIARSGSQPPSAGFGLLIGALGLLLVVRRRNRR